MVGLALQDIQEGMSRLELDHLDELTNQAKARADVQELLLTVLE